MTDAVLRDAWVYSLTTLGHWAKVLINQSTPRMICLVAPPPPARVVSAADRIHPSTLPPPHPQTGVAQRPAPRTPSPLRSHGRGHRPASLSRRAAAARGGGRRRGRLWVAGGGGRRRALLMVGARPGGVCGGWGAASLLARRWGPPVERVSPPICVSFVAAVGRSMNGMYLRNKLEPLPPPSYPI